MPLDETLKSILACPVCKGELEFREAEDCILCHTCRLRFRIEDGIPNMLPEEAESLTEEAEPCP